MSAIDARILDEAAVWLARARASDFGEREQSELARWRNRSAEHEAVWQRAQQLNRQMDALPPSVAMAVLNRPRSATGRRHMLRTAALALSAPMLGWFAYRFLPWDLWGADYRTATGESRSVTLADGSRVMLNTGSAIRTRFDGQARRVQQIAGEILVETSHAGAFQNQPFIVETGDGLMRALGTRFIIRKHERSTLLSVLQGAVRVSPSHASEAAIVRAGERLRFDSQGLGPVTPLSALADAWTRGVLFAENMRLKDFLAELSRYREGALHCEPDAADLMVSGVFQLGDTDRILELLEQTLPVRVLARTRYWITVTRA
ncbi:FecR domain-containing protein [Diaphorobacter ruginosibacter]|uniref:FecR domain-containing protein n=1 Tax=Diaphorobacter ruginosibacter TaxID=1715720 RepID=UPI003342623F